MGRDESSGYILRGGDQGAQRLRLLARAKWPTTRALFRRVDLRAGMHVLDIGCGSGAVTLKMARWVGPTGRALGIDTDERCLELARQDAIGRRLTATFRMESVGDLREEAAYDLVYSRFLLTHLPDPGQALAHMVRAARTGGLVVVEDVEFSGHFSHPACPAFDRYIRLYQEMVRRRGGDPDIGPRLPGLFTDAGLEGVGLEVVQPTFREGPGKHIAAVTMEHIREAVVGAGLAGPEEVTTIVAELDHFADNPRTLLSMPRIFQVWGWKAPS
jgi:ubiquinone/menaquinone biosynthesis C-methylase UbiE